MKLPTVKQMLEGNELARIMVNDPCFPCKHLRPTYTYKGGDGSELSGNTCCTIVRSTIYGFQRKDNKRLPKIMPRDTCPHYEMK